MTGGPVLLVHEFPGAFGGAERYLEILGSGLVAAGVPTAAVVFVADADAAARLAPRLGAIAPDTRVIAGRARPGPIRAAVREHDPVVVHWNFVDPFAFRGASFLLLPWGRPSVITDHLPQLRHAGPHWETTRRLANRRIATMIVVGDAAAREAEARWRRPPPIAVIPNGVPVGAAPRRPSGPPRRPRLLFVGRLTEQKGVSHLVPVLAAVRARGIDAELRVVGDGPRAGDIAAAAEANDLGGQVELVGFAPSPAEEMAAADVLVAPSAYEGLPFTPLEALAVGLPLVLSDIAPHRELVTATDPLGVQVVAPGDERGWAEAVERALAAPAEASGAAHRIARGHRAEAMVEATRAVYRAATA
ncbi:MAG: glycosyltransferase family 4 protein [Acidimicrobiales bacterium]|nr:glycosyltransferase family 4 protein [Acidimicrobiales bacterium]MCB1018016.1 glycosyltransferase family 4 protein [Acidimicrobiales bacterium]MCB9372773.1 glycosyltransferase family 4 protein [Microthrixaceae bacterium]